MAPVKRHEFVTHATQVAKRDQIKRNGIGDTLPVCLYGWTGNDLQGIASVTTDDHQHRLAVIGNAAFEFRRNLGVTGLTLALEGWRADWGHPTPERFVRNDTDEVLVTLHVETVPVYDGEDWAMVTVPFTCLPGREVRFGAPNMERESGRYVEMLRLALTAAPGFDGLFALPGATLWVAP